MNEPNSRRLTAEEKLWILVEARQSAHTVREVCRRYQIEPTQLYLRQNQARQGALAAVRPQKPGRKRGDPVPTLEAEIERLRRVSAESTTDNLQLKRGIGRSPPPAV